jgi:trehalose 6-phosphate synthase
VECEQPASGLTIALDPIMQACGGTWVASSSGDADHEYVDNRGHTPVPPDRPTYTLRRIWLSKEQQMRYYYGLANQGLWPLCHIVYTRPKFDPDDWSAYKEVNELFVDAVLEEAGDGPALVFIQDYHFAVMSRMLKERNPNLTVAQFWHIPWPNPEVFRSFPWKGELLDGILGNDLLGFHLRLHCQNFLDTVDSAIEARVDRERFEVTRNGKITTVRPFPVSIDFDTYMRAAQDEEVKREQSRWRSELNLKGAELLGVGVDRIDYTKGIAERFRAVERLLGKHPEYREWFVFVQIGVPSRIRIRQYKQLEEELEALAAEINWKWTGKSSRPIVFITEHHNRSQLIALNKLSRFCVVSSLHDGMNLVAKEYVASRPDADGVLILSEFAGASRELTDALLVNPFNEEELADAMKEALEMPLDERKRRMQRMQAVVAENNIYRWAGKIVSTALKLEATPVGQSDAAFA